MTGGPSGASRRRGVTTTRSDSERYCFSHRGMAVAKQATAQGKKARASDFEVLESIFFTDFAKIGYGAPGEKGG